MSKNTSKRFKRHKHSLLQPAQVDMHSLTCKRSLEMETFLNDKNNDEISKSVFVQYITIKYFCELVANNKITKLFKGNKV